MFFHMVMFVWEFVLDLVAVMRMANDEKDLEIMLWGLKSPIRCCFFPQATLR